MKEQLLSNAIFLRDVLGPVVMLPNVPLWSYLFYCCVVSFFPHFTFSCVVVRLCEATGESVAWRVVSRRAVACYLNGLKLSTIMTQETNQKDSSIHKYTHTYTHMHINMHTHESLSAYPRICQSNIKRINCFVFMTLSGFFPPENRVVLSGVQSLWRT